MKALSVAGWLVTVVAAVLTVMHVFSFFFINETPPHARQQPSAAKSASDPATARPPLDLTGLRDANLVHPLFEAPKPAVTTAASAAPTPPPPPPPTLKLLATIVEPRHSSAIIQIIGGRSLCVSVGDVLEGATVAEILTGSVRLTRGQTTHTLELPPPPDIAGTATTRPYDTSSQQPPRANANGGLQ